MSSISEMLKLLEHYSKSPFWDYKLSAPAQKALAEYADAGTGASNINDRYRNFYNNYMPQPNDPETLIQKSMKPLKSDSTLYRGINDQLDNYNTFGNQGLMSTSEDRGTANFFGDKLHRILVPSGTPVVPAKYRIRNMPYYESGEPGANDWNHFEGEWLLPPDSRFSLLHDDGSIKTLMLTSAGKLKRPAYVPKVPGVGYLAGALPLGLLDKYSGDQSQ